MRSNIPKKPLDEQKQNKRERQKILKEIISENKIFNQKEIRRLFKRNYEIVVPQTTISRDLKELGIEKDKEKKYVLGQKVARNAEARRLTRVLRDADASLINGNFESLMLKMRPSYVELAAEKIDALFSIEDIEVYMFPGFNGTLLIYFDRSKGKMVKRHMRKIIESFQKSEVENEGASGANEEEIKEPKKSKENTAEAFFENDVESKEKINEEQIKKTL